MSLTLDQLLDRLRRQGGPADALLLADLLWLSERLPWTSPEPDEGDGDTRGDTHGDGGGVKAPGAGDAHLSEAPQASRDKPKRSATRAVDTEAATPPTPPGGRSTVQVRAAPPRSAADAVLRAEVLAPLVHARREDDLHQLDEPRTVARFAATGFCEALFEQRKDKRTLVSVVLDLNRTMGPWRPQVGPFLRLLRWQRSFRAVRLLGLRTGKEVQLCDASGQRALRDEAALDPTGRGLTVVLTDCIGEGWWTGAVAEQLEAWSRRQPLMVFQVLPEPLWRRTALSRTRAGKLAGEQPFSHRGGQRWRERSFSWLDEAEERHLPLMPWTTPALKAWVKHLVGDQPVNARAFAPAGRAPPGTGETAEARLEAFLRSSSAQAAELAALAAVSPVLSLPVVRLIRDLALSGDDPLPLAELWMGGLLRVQRLDVDPEATLYDFEPELRALLMRRVPMDLCQRVMPEVARQLEQSHAPWARALADPLGAEDLSELEPALAGLVSKLRRSFAGALKAHERRAARPRLSGHVRLSLTREGDPGWLSTGPVAYRYADSLGNTDTLTLRWTQAAVNHLTGPFTGTAPPDFEEVRRQLLRLPALRALRAGVEGVVELEVEVGGFELLRLPVDLAGEDAAPAGKVRAWFHAGDNYFPYGIEGVRREPELFTSPLHGGQTLRWALHALRRPLDESPTIVADFSELASRWTQQATEDKTRSELAVLLVSGSEAGFWGLPGPSVEWVPPRSAAIFALGADAGLAKVLRAALELHRRGTRAVFAARHPLTERGVSVVLGALESFGGSYIDALQAAKLMLVSEKLSEEADSLLLLLHPDCQHEGLRLHEPSAAPPRDPLDALLDRLLAQEDPEALRALAQAIDPSLAERMVLDLLSGEESPRQLSRKHGVTVEAVNLLERVYTEAGRAALIDLLPPGETT
ncbi:MAG: hypothetical protein H6741_30210 [Alphaproteobacteria bacterium]|nr:hypothetical protein [Alphaproteobacteria bacterium]